MKTSTMTIKGQVTVPKEFRDSFGWKAGDRVEFFRETDGVKMVRRSRQPQGRAAVERLRRAPWRRGLSTDRLMAMTRGGRD